MKKIIFLLFLSAVSIYSKTVEFVEGKYIEAFDLYTNRDGNVSFDANQTVISYKDGKRIVKIDNIIDVYNASNELLTTINVIEKPEVGLYFTLTKALFEKDFESLKNNFYIEKKDNTEYIFVSKDEVKNIMNNIKLFLKEDNSVSFFILNFTNGDKIKIEAK